MSSKLKQCHHMGLVHGVHQFQETLSQVVSEPYISHVNIIQYSGTFIIQH